MMGLANSIFLITLVGIALPVIIHLWSRRTPRTIPFGSIRFLRESETRTLRRIQPSEIPLLVFRILLIALLAVALSEPWSERALAVGDRVLLVDTNYRDREEVQALRDTCDPDITKWMAKDFPSISEDPAAYLVPNLWQLTADAEALPFEKVTIWSPRTYEQFGSVAPEIPSGIHWVALPEREASRPVDTISSTMGTKLITLDYSQEPARLQQLQRNDITGDTLQLSLFFEVEAGYESLEMLLKTSVKAINRQGLLQVKEVTDAASADWLVWLRNDEPPLRTGLLQANPFESSLSRVAPGVYQIGGGLTDRDFVAKHIPLRLETLFIDNHGNLNQVDPRTVPADQLKAFEGTPSGKGDFSERQSWQDLLWLILAIALLAERWWSLRVGQHE